MALLLAAAVLLLMTIVLLFAIQWWKEKREHRRIVSLFPGPEASLLLGNLDKMTPTEKSLSFNESLLLRFPKLFRLWAGPLFGVIIATHHDVIKRVLLNSTPKSEEFYRLLRPWLGDGLLISKGKKWLRNRRLLTPGFHFEILRSYIDIYNEATNILLTKWKYLAKNEKAVDVFDSSCYLALDVVLRCACSYESNCQTQSESAYVRSIVSLNEIPVARVLFPPYRSDFIFYFTPMGWRARKAVRTAHQHSEAIIRNRKMQLISQNLENQRGKRSDFLDILLLAKDDEGRGLTDTEIRDEVDTFIFEGHDTTSSGLAFTLINLARFPDFQQKCYEEIKSVLSNRKNVTWDDLGKFTYLSMFIKESLRLYPPVPFIYRTVEEPFEVDGFSFSKGCEIVLAITLAHRNPHIWENPDKFDPLRFSAEAAKNRDPFAYLPFSGGARNCIGQNFALHEMKTALALTLSRFELLPDSSCELKRAPYLILKTENGGRVYLRDRGSRDS
ncbi:leukotriene-B4 omega-hydroxylase 3-like [Oscarella lobularis]|uniref:leukotriene-B4 omega-hydroxylase 3-like n=1 Tax=Oscarella lobularis TaxID=121494 RepID=UPI0033135813